MQALERRIGRPKLLMRKRAGWTDMHTDLCTPEVKRLDPKDKDAIEM
jgi:hypothetical protein